MQTLTEGTDYRVFYQNNVNTGEGKVIVKGNGIYKGQVEQPFTISKKSIKKLKVIAGSITGDVKDAKISELPICVYDGTISMQAR